MKTTKIIFTTVLGLALLSLVSCSSTKSLPKDEVYYTPGSEPAVTTVKHTGIAKNTNHQNYSQGEIVSGSDYSNYDTTYQTEDDYYDGDYAARLKRFYGSEGSSLDYDDGYYTSNYDDDNYGYCSGNPDVNISFGFGVGYGWGLGFGWGYPYYGWGYPYYGWGYPYYGYPYYGYGAGYWDGYWNGYWDGYYGFYPSPYPYYPSYPHYPDYGYGYASVYRPRGNRTSGTNLPRYGSAGGSRSAINNGDNYKTVVAGSGTAAGNATSNKLRVGSNEYVNTAVGYRSNTDGKKVSADSRKKQNNIRTGTSEAIPARNKAKAEPKPRSAGSKTYALNTRQKPVDSRNNIRQEPVKRKSTKSSVKPRYSKPSSYSRYSKERTMQKPKYSKPRQYQRLDTQQPRGSKEYYRPQSKQNVKQRGSTAKRESQVSRKPNRNVNGKSRVAPQRKHNVYRPSTTRNSGMSTGTRRPSVKTKPSSGKVRSYSSPSRSYSSPKSYSSPSRSRSTGSSRGGGLSSSYSAPSRSSGSFSGGSRSTSSSSSSSRGGIRR